jgi:ELWxxDGT repeat protein
MIKNNLISLYVLYLIAGGIAMLSNIVQAENQCMVLVKDINTMGSSNPRGLTIFNSVLFFVAEDDTGETGLWITNGNAKGTKLLKSFGVNMSLDLRDTGSSSYSHRTYKSLYFVVSNRRVIGGEPAIWRSDGTPEGTLLVKKMSVFGGHSQFIEINGEVFFAGFTLDYGEELWKTNGTPEGTVLVKDIYPGRKGSYPFFLTAFQGLLYFTAGDDDSYVEHAWQSNGTEEGTHKTDPLIWQLKNGIPVIKDVTVSKNISVYGGIHYQDGFYFMMDSTVWRVTDPLGGSYPVSISHPGLDFNTFAKNPGLYTNDLYFHGLYLHKFKDTLLIWNPKFYLDSFSRGFSLGVLDSNHKGVTNIKNGSGWGGDYLAIFQNHFFFVITEYHPERSKTNGPNVLYVSDGTAEGTRPIDLGGVRILFNKSTFKSYIFDYPVNINKNLLFIGEDGVHGKELWKIKRKCIEHGIFMR